MNETLTITADKADQMVNAHVAKNNNGRRIPSIPAHTMKLMERDKWYIFNVSPIPFPQHMGSSGMWYIPACEEGQPYSKPLVVPGVVVETVVKNERAMYLAEDDGEFFANEVIGIGRGRDKNKSLERNGVFKTQNNPPAPEELAAAKRHFRQYCQMLVTEAKDAYRDGEAKWREVQRPDHFMAARELKLNEKEHPWMGATAEPAERSVCAGCGVTYSLGIERCPTPNCGRVLDMDRFRQSVAEGRYPGVTLESLGIKRGPGRPPKERAEEEE